jgi:uncharacterized membrane protein
MFTRAGKFGTRSATASVPETTMQTKARIAGHPIHPMMVAFPIAFYVSTVVALFVFLATDNPFWFSVALWANIAGVVTAACAAAPGLVDLLSLDRRSAARVVGLRHAGFNALALILFAASAGVLYHNTATLSVAAPLVLGILGLAATVTAGWLGWTLVQTYHVGVHELADDHVGGELPNLDMPASYRETYSAPPVH